MRNMGLSNKIILLSSVGLLTLFLTACGGGSSGGGTPLGDDTSDAPDPVETVISLSADAGKDQNVHTTDLVRCDGSASTSTEGATLTYLWRLIERPEGSTVGLSKTDIVNPEFVADLEGSYTVGLTISDSSSNSTEDMVVIIATTGNAAPVADAGVEQEVNRGSTVTLDGSGSSDADFDALSYQWDFTYRPEGSSAVLRTPTESAPTFIADKSGSYIIKLIVDDGTTQSIADEITITSIGNSGILDTTFGGDGIITHGNAAGGDGTDIGTAIAVDGAGNVYVTGSSVNIAGNKDMVIWKYRANGTLDTSFGGDGMVVHYNTLYDDQGNDIAIDSTGDVYVTGFNTYVDGESTKTSVIIWKFKSDGRADRTFSDNGIVTNPGHDVGKAIVLDSDGSIYIMSSAFVWKYRSDGTLITTFGQDGRASHTSPSDIPYAEIGDAMALDSIGNIYVTGYETLDSLDAMNLMIWKFNKDGVLDPTFGNDSFFGLGGTVRYNNDEFSRFFGMAISFDSGGKFYIAGYAQEHGYEIMHQMVLWKYTDEGLLDSTFDVDGIVTHNLTELLDAGTSMVLDTVGNIYVSGHSGEKMITRKYRSDGSFDTTFGDEGIVIHEGAIRQWYRGQVPNAITIDSVGNIFVTSQGERADGNFDMMIWKYK